MILVYASNNSFIVFFPGVLQEFSNMYWAGTQKAKTQRYMGRCAGIAHAYG